jgi:hypothetical protein
MAGLDFADERIHRVVGGDGGRRGQRADQAHRVARQPDLLFGLAQRGVAQVLLLAGLELLATAGEGDLSPVAAQVDASAGEDDVDLAAVHVQRHEHGRVDASVHVQPGRVLGGQQPGAQLLDDRCHADASARRR